MVTPDITAQIPTTGSRGQPLKMAQYLEEGKKLMAAVKAYRATRDEAGAEEPEVAPVPPKPKRKSYPLPVLDRPSEIPGFPLNPPKEALDIPDYSSIGRVKATRAAQAERRGKRAPVTPIGPSELRKRGQ